MAYILNIETSGNLCSVALGHNGQLLALKEESVPNSHAKLCAVFVDEALKEIGLNPNELNAVAVSEGPGSYTGLRIGISIAKGICYAMNIPLIALSTLQLIARETAMAVQDKTALYAPLIDARRMEVYTAVYDYNNQQITPVSPQIITDDFQQHLLQNNIVYYSGSGAEKCKTVITHKNARFHNSCDSSAKDMLYLSQQHYNNNHFVNAAYFEPVYLKLFGEVIK